MSKSEDDRTNGRGWNGYNEDEIWKERGVFLFKGAVQLFILLRYSITYSYLNKCDLCAAVQLVESPVVGYWGGYILKCCEDNNTFFVRKDNNNYNSASKVAFFGSYCDFPVFHFQKPWNLISEWVTERPVCHPWTRRPWSPAILKSLILKWLIKEIVEKMFINIMQFVLVHA
jgi:hypothetical protein